MDTLDQENYETKFSRRIIQNKLFGPITGLDVRK